LNEIILENVIVQMQGVDVEGMAPRFCLPAAKVAYGEPGYVFAVFETEMRMPTGKSI
jgi:hypothetical protein